MKKINFIPATLLLCGVVICHSNAQVNIASWDFNGVSPGTAGTILDTTGTVASIFNAAGVSATIGRITPSITNLPPGGGTGMGLDYVAPYNLGTASAGILSANGFGAAPSSSSYVSFRITIGGVIDPTVALLQGLTFDLANAGTSGPRGVEVTYRVGDSGMFVSLGTTRTPTNVASQFGNFTFDLPSPVALIASESVEFRLLGYTDLPANSIRLDNVIIRATAIPEPSKMTLLMLLASLVALVALRRHILFINKTN